MLPAFCSFHVGKWGQGEGPPEGPGGAWNSPGCSSLGYSAPPAVCLPSPEGDSDIQCVLQDCSSPESDGSPGPRRPGGPAAASGSQEKLDFHRNLKEGKICPSWRQGPALGGLGCCLSSPWCFPVVPAIEKLLSSDWKERFLGRCSVETKDVKGKAPGVPGGAWLSPFPFWPGHAVWICKGILGVLGALIPDLRHSGLKTQPHLHLGTQHVGLAHPQAGGITARGYEFGL